MAGISNINNAYNVDLKRVHKKLSFEIGESFSARIIDLEQLTGEAVLKLLDGWQFSAQLKDPLEFIQNKLMKFEVEGYENGKIILKVLQDNQEQNKENLESFLENQGINLKKDDYEILEKMIKHNMPLTKENISKVKTLLDFKGKIECDSLEQKDFINKYLSNKGIDITSDKATKIRNVLNGFFNELKSVNMDEILTLLENDIELTENNIKSFNKINKEPNCIYNEISDLDDSIESDNIKPGEVKGNLELKEENNNSMDKINKEQVQEKNTLNKNLSKKSTYIENAYNNEGKDISGKEILKKLLDLDIKNNESNLLPNDNEKILNKSLDKDKIQNLGEKEPIQKEVSFKEIESKKEIIKDVILEKTNNKVMETSDKVKEQLNNKIEEMKSIIKNIIDDSNNGKSKMMDKVIQTLQNKMNDFKVFNSISNQYYYLDVPVNVNETEYPCKLIIKDDRKKGKKIDSTNVKFVLCVKTINLGVVDAYIKVRNLNLGIDIKCDKSWIKMLNSGTKKVMDKLDGLGYVANIQVSEKQNDVNLVECKDFFEDNDFTRINFRV